MNGNPEREVEIKCKPSDKLTRSQEQFLNYFIEQDFKNARKAYMRAYPKASAETADVNSCRALSKTKFQSRLAEKVAEALAKDKIPIEKRIFELWAKRAFYDTTDILEKNGTLAKTMEELKAEGLSVCVDGIKTKVNAQGITTVEYKLADRDKAADMLSRYVQMIKEPPKQVELGGGIQLLKVDGNDPIK
jgi:hypothetical protein